MDRYKKYSISKYITGSCWIITGILGHCNSIVTNAIRIAFLVLLVSVLMYQTAINLDKSEQETFPAVEGKNFANAVCYAFCAMAILTFVISLVFAEKDWNWLFRIMCVLSIMLGLIDIRTGVTFSKPRGRKAVQSDKRS